MSRPVDLNGVDASRQATYKCCTNLVPIGILGRTQGVDWVPDKLGILGNRKLGSVHRYFCSCASCFSERKKYRRWLAHRYLGRRGWLLLVVVISNSAARRHFSVIVIINSNHGHSIGGCTQNICDR
jgi:hypothetical protein